MNIGVCGAGTIASWVSDFLEQLHDERIVKYGVASAFPAECEPFAKKWNWKKCYPDYDTMMADPAIDLIYVAVPNNFHYEVCMKALDAGKHVVVEKPFAVNYEQAQAMVDKAKEKDVFLSEALWPAFLPSRKAIDEVIASGEIGELTGGRLIALDNVMFLDRVKRLDLGGGSLLDMGPYMLGRMTNHFGNEITAVESSMEFLDTGVDCKDTYTITFGSGCKVSCVSTINTPRENHKEYAVIEGTNGSIHLECIANPKNIRIFDKDGHMVRKLELAPSLQGSEMPFLSGYEHEWIAFEKAIREGKTETDETPLAQTLAIAKAMTEIRAQNGLRFPFE